MNGRPRKPSKFLIDRRRNSPGPEPVLPASNLAAPADLSEDAAAEWARSINPLIWLGILSDNDVSGAAALCEAWARYIAAIRRLRAEGDIVETERGPTVNPSHRIAKDALADYMKLCPQFGIFPANRSRVSGTPDKAPATADKGRFFKLKVAK